MISLVPATADAEADGRLQHPPAFKKFISADRQISVSNKSRVTVSDALESSFNDAVEEFKEALRLALPEDGAGLTISIDTPRGKTPEDPAVASALSHAEGYAIQITPEGIRVLGADPAGALHGLTTLELRLAEGRGRLEAGTVLDWPDTRTRAFHIVLGTRSKDEISDLIRRLRFGHFNTLVVELGNGVALESMAGIERSPLVRGNVWSIEDLLDVARKARENGLDVVPHLSLLTKQHKLLRDSRPGLMFNSSTYDPRNKETYEAVLPIIDEVIDLLKPRAFHIGHDEVAGHDEKSRRKWLKEGEPELPPELFLKDVLLLHGHLAGRGVETWMWGDMLLGAGGFPGMNGEYFHADSGYEGILGRLPPEIVICDWRYKEKGADFPSSLAFSRSGHRVIGATWRDPKTIRNFSSYIAGMPGGEGMMATTWGPLINGRWDVVLEIAEESSHAFWNARRGP